MMKIPYEQILEVRTMKDDIDKTKSSRVSKWFYNKGYQLQCRPIIKRLEDSTKQINYIDPSDLVSFAIFASQTFVPNTNIEAITKSFLGEMTCTIKFNSVGVSVTATSAKGERIHLIEYSKKKDVQREVVALNTGIEPGRGVYNAMIDYIVKYLKGE